MNKWLKMEFDGAIAGGGETECLDCGELGEGEDMREWKEYQISEICSEITDCVNKTARTVDYKTPFKMIRTTNIKSGKIDLENVRYVTEDIYNIWTRRGELKRNDIILTREAPVGEVGILKSDDKYFLGQRTMLYRANPKIADQIFLYYAFLTQELKETFISLGMGSVVEHIRVPDAGKFNVKLPSLPEQEAIASVLSSLDDKIDLLHRQNKTLEAMAETLFRQWFVEEVQEDWEEVMLADVCSAITKGTTPTTLGHKFVEAGINFVKAESITDSGDFIFEKFAHISEETHHLLKRSIIQSGDVLCSIAGTIGRVAIVNSSILPANTNQAIAILRVNQEKCQSEFVYLFLKSTAFREIMDGKIVHAVQPNLSLGEIGNTTFLLPPHDVLRKFEKVISPVFEKKGRNTLQIRTLENIRDTLLPKLMSGEIRVIP
jgi:type I restriction enzyme S subunit